VLQRRGAHLEEHPELRVHDLRVTRPHAEEPGVEELDVLEDGRGLNVIRISEALFGHARRP
jgi:hypothetical protein